MTAQGKATGLAGLAQKELYIQDFQTWMETKLPKDQGVGEDDGCEKQQLAEDEDFSDQDLDGVAAAAAASSAGNVFRSGSSMSLQESLTPTPKNNKKSPGGAQVGDSASVASGTTKFDPGHWSCLMS